MLALKKIKAVYLERIFLFFLVSSASASYDLTLISSTIKFATGLERLPITITDMLMDDIKINFRQSMVIDYKDIPARVKTTLSKNINTEVGTVSLLLDPLWYPDQDFYKAVPNSPIKLAYSMLESTKLPDEWTHILNNYFDAVIVPDPWLVNVYKNSGVTIPIFVLPIGLHLSAFLKMPAKTCSNNIFTFGLSAAAAPGKNHEMVIDAFVEEFLQNPLEQNNVRLRIHSRGGSKTENIKKYLQQQPSTAIEFIPRSLSQREYLQFISSLDCYILLSMGEGFSITPREALAAGIPCILSNSTAQKTICKSSFVEVVEASISVPAYYDIFKETLGVKFNCTLAAARKAMRNVYTNYSAYLEKAQAAREWVKRYQDTTLKDKYLTLVKPKKIILGKKNRIANSVIETTSPSLYEKYLHLISQSQSA